MKTWMKTLALGLVLGAVACEDAGTEPRAFDDDLIKAEAALVAADGMFQDLSLAQDPELQVMGFDGIGMMLAGGQGGNGGQCIATGTQGSFNCGQMSRDGFTFEREVTFYDEFDEVQDGFIQGETDAIHLIMSGEGTRERSFWTATMTRYRDMWMENLLSDEHLLNGEGSSSVYRSGNPQNGSEMTFDMNVEITWENVLHIQPREDNPWPASGTITREIFVEVTKDGEVVGGRNVTTVVEFNGTQYVTMLVDGEPVEIDLAEGGVNARLGGNGRFGNGNAGNG